MRIFRWLKKTSNSHGERDNHRLLDDFDVKDTSSMNQLMRSMSMAFNRQLN